MLSDPNTRPPSDRPASNADSATPVRISTSKKLVFALGVVAIFLLAAELLCRAFGLGRHEAVAHYISDWHDTPDGRTFWVVRGTGYNRDGMRDREHAVEKAPGVHRIACLGDSVTAGHGVKRSESYPYIFEAYLKQLGLPAEVFNIAASGWSTRQQAAAYSAVALRYQPDQAILGFCLNDVAEMQNNLTEPPPALVGTFLRHSALLRCLVRAEARQVHSVRELFHQPDAPAVQAGWQLVFAELDFLHAETRKDGCELWVVIFPFRFQLEPEAPEPIAQQTLATFCRSRDIPCLDLLPALREVGPDALIDDSHLSAAGAAVVAEELVRWGQALHIADSEE